MATRPTAIVTGITNVEADPADPENKFLITWDFQILFCGDPMAQQATISLDNTATKSQIKTAIDDYMINAFTQLPTGSFTLSTNRIWTVGDIAG